MVIELITAINNANFKIRKLSEDIFLRISYLLSHFNATSQLLQILLVGFAGNSPQTKSCTIRALIYNLKANVAWKHEIRETKEEIDNLSDSEDEAPDRNKFTKILASTPEVQDFIVKVTKIIALFLKDASAPKELHRSVLKFIKVAITYIDFEDASKAAELLPLILSHVFSLAKPSDYATVIRRIVSKLMFRVGPATVKRHTL